MLGNTLSWVAANWSNLLGLLAVLIASASVLIKALEAIVNALVSLFPSLKTADGDLVKAAAWLDALAQAKWLNAVALSPKADK